MIISITGPKENGLAQKHEAGDLFRPGDKETIDVIAEEWPETKDDEC